MNQHKHSCQDRPNSKTSSKPQAEAKPAGLPKLAKADTVALWYAVNWMDLCLRGTKPEGVDTAAWEAEKDRLRAAKQALRKVNKVRKNQNHGVPTYA